MKTWRPFILLVAVIAMCIGGFEYNFRRFQPLEEGTLAAGSYTKIRVGTSLPATCTYSDGGLFMLLSGGTSAALYACTANNTWSILVATSGSGNGALDISSSSTCSSGASNFVRFCGNSNVASVSENAGTVKPLVKYLTASDAAVDLASVATGACTSQRTVSVTGAAFNNQVEVSAGTALQAGTFLVGEVSSSGNVQWQFCNLSGGAVDRASDTYTITVLQ